MSHVQMVYLSVGALGDRNDAGALSQKILTCHCTEDCRQDLNAVWLHPTRLQVRASEGAT